MPGHRVLVVDDDEDIRESLIDFLGDHGYEAVGAVDGRDALTKLGAAPQPCVIILDLMMPIMDGKAFREEQLRTPALSQIPVIVISAHRRGDKAVQGLDVIDHLPKPLDLQVLLDTLQARCQPRLQSHDH